MFYLLLIINILTNGLYSIQNSETIYNLMLDRFYDGDTNNNIPVYAYGTDTKYDKWNKKVLPLMFDLKKRSWNKFWGGDLKGLTDKLSYIKDMGISTILVSPIFQNANGYISIQGAEPRITSYHGYWLKDLYRLDEHFISHDSNSKKGLYEQGDEQLSKLINKAHKLGLKVLLDININHSSPTKDGLKYITTLTEYELQDGAIFKNGVFISSTSGFFNKRFDIPIKDENWFNKAPSIIWDKNKRKKLAESYRELGFPIYGDTPSIKERTTFMLHGLADFNHNNTNVQEYIITAMKKWTKMGVDGYRIDAIRHIPEEFIIKLKKELIRENPQLILIGEWFDFSNDNKEAISFSQKTGISMFDFQKMKEIREIYINGKKSFHELKNMFSNDDQNRILFIENQDLPRVLSTKKMELNKYNEMLKLMMILKGSPCIYYGSEVYLHDKSYKNGHSSFGVIGNDPWNRDQMKWEKKAKKQKAYYIIKTLSELRKKNTALKKGTLELIKTNDNILAIRRQFQDKKLIYISSISDIDQNISLDINLPSGKYQDPINKTTYEMLNGKINLTLKPFHSVLIYN